MHEWNHIKINIKTFENKSIKVEIGPCQTHNHIHLKFIEWIPCQHLITMTKCMLIIWLKFILQSQEIPMASHLKKMPKLIILSYEMDVSYQSIIFFSSAHQHSLYKTISPSKGGPCLWGICNIYKVQHTRAMSTFSNFPINNHFTKSFQWLQITEN